MQNRQEPDKYFELAELLAKFLKGELSTTESEILRSRMEKSAETRQLWKRLTDPGFLKDGLNFWNPGGDKEAEWEKLLAGIQESPHKSRFTFRKVLRYAAIFIPVVLASATGWYLFSHSEKNPPVTKESALAGIHIMPHGKVARLILGSGQVVNLNDSLQNLITEKDGTRLRNQSSTLVYSVNGVPGGAATIYNTLLTPRGGEYQITLSDGTKVWLNASSSLRYPTQFNEQERRIYLSGEAYFEVAKDVAHPFIVSTGSMNLTVLGTKFNVNSYPDDPEQKTTLAEGAVRISNTVQEGGRPEDVVLTPGMASVIQRGDAGISVHTTDVEASLAWKNGLFVFSNESLGAIMRRLSRWYDVEVKYDDDVNDRLHFTGRIRRYENITGILKLLEMTGKVRFSLGDHALHVALEKPSMK